MKTLHMRLSVELEVTDEQFAEVVRIAKEDGYWDDVEYLMIPDGIQEILTSGNYEICDWDNGGYIPGAWIEADERYNE